jgi:hypothetical protein
MAEFTVEAFRKTGAPWFILGIEDTSAEAQRKMAAYRAAFPDLPLRVVENPSRVLVLLNDPRPLDCAPGAP